MGAGRRVPESSSVFRVWRTSVVLLEFAEAAGGDSPLYHVPLDWGEAGVVDLSYLSESPGVLLDFVVGVDGVGSYLD